MDEKSILSSPTLEASGNGYGEHYDDKDVFGHEEDHQV